MIFKMGLDPGNECRKSAGLVPGMVLVGEDMGPCVAPVFKTVALRVEHN